MMLSCNRFYNLDSSDAEMGADGWPKGDFKAFVCDYRPHDEWRGPDSIDDPNAVRCDISGEYELIFSGLAKMTPEEGFESTLTIGAVEYDEGRNETTATVRVGKPGPNHGAIFIRFTDTRKTPEAPLGSGIGSIRMIAPGYQRDSKQIFTDSFLRALEPFSTMRVMDMLETNNKATFEGDAPGLLEWDERVRPGTALHPPRHGRVVGSEDAGWAWEYVIELANVSGNDIHICVPVSASDNYVRNLANLFSDELNPQSRIYIEYSNEIWNSMFKQSQWVQKKAQSIVQQSEDHPINYDGEAALDAEVARKRYGVYRSMEIVELFREAFAERRRHERIRMLVSYDAMEDGLDMLRSQVGEPSDYFWAYAIACYFNIPNDLEKGRNIEQILDYLEMRVDALDYEFHVDRGRKWGLKTVGYEGGPNTSPGLGRLETNLDTVMSAVRKPRMGEILLKNLNKAHDAGLEWMSNFTLCGPYSRWGTWGLTEDTKKLDTPKYQAVMEFIASD